MLGKSLNKVKNKLTVFIIELVNSICLLHLTISACNKILSRYAQRLSNSNAYFNRWDLTSFVQIVIKAVFCYTGFCRKFFDEHSRVCQFRFQVFFEPHRLIIIG